MDAVVVTCGGCGAGNRVPRARLGDRPRCGRCKAPLFSDRPVAVSDDRFAAEVEGSPIPVLVDFWAPWCGPCRMVAPVLDQVAAERAGRLKVIKVNTDECPRVAARFGIQSIPTLMLWKGAAPVDQVAGALPKPHLDAWLSRHL